MRFSHSAPPVELSVVGEHKFDPEQLLFLGEDGHYYAFAIPTGKLTLVSVDEFWDVQGRPWTDLLE
jgi:hypothetical protein